MQSASYVSNCLICKHRENSSVSLANQRSRMKWWNCQIFVRVIPMPFLPRNITDYHAVRFRFSNQLNFPLLLQEKTVRLASHWPCGTDFGGLSTYRLNGHGKGDEYPTYAPYWGTVHFYSKKEPLRVARAGISRLDAFQINNIKAPKEQVSMWQPHELGWKYH